MVDAVAGLTFSPLAVVLVESSFVRGVVANKKNATVRIEFEVSDLEYTDDGETQIVTQFRVTVLPGEAEHGSDDAIAIVVSKYAATFQASRQLDVEEIEEGVLDALQDVAHEILHPYHRQRIAYLTALTGMSPFELPLTWAEVASKVDGGSSESESHGEPDKA